MRVLRQYGKKTLSGQSESMHIKQTEDEDHGGQNPVLYLTVWGLQGTQKHPVGMTDSVFIACKIERESIQDIYLRTQQTCVRSYFGSFYC